MEGDRGRGLWDVASAFPALYPDPQPLNPSSEAQNLTFNFIHGRGLGEAWRLPITVDQTTA